MTNATQVTLGASGRAALRNAIRAKSNKTAPGYRDPKHLGKNELLAQAQALGIDVANVLANAPEIATSATPEAAEPEALNVAGDAGDTPDASLPASLSPVDRANAILSLPVVGLRKAIEELAAEAAKPPVTIEVEKIVYQDRVVDAASGAALVVSDSAPRRTVDTFVPQVQGTLSAAEAFGFNPKDRNVPATLRTTMVDLWNDPTAPAVDHAYRFDQELLADVIAAHEGGTYCWSAGPAGTGKSTFWEQFAARLGRSFVQIVCDKTLSRLELFGGYQLHNGSTRWEHGVLTLAIQRPGTVVLLDEPSAARPGELISLHGLLVPGGRLTLETGDVIYPADGVYFAAADNTAGRGDDTGQYIDTGPMNAAFLNRWGVVCQFEYLSAEVEAELLTKRVPGLPLVVALMLAEVAATARAGVLAGNLTVAPSLRNLIAWGKQIMAQRPVMRSAEVTMLSTLNAVDREAMHQIVLAKVNVDTVEAALAGKAVATPTPSVSPDNANPF